MSWCYNGKLHRRTGCQSRPAEHSECNDDENAPGYLSKTCRSGVRTSKHRIKCIYTRAADAITEAGSGDRLAGSSHPSHRVPSPLSQFFFSAHLFTYTIYSIFALRYLAYRSSVLSSHQKPLPPVNTIHLPSPLSLRSRCREQIRSARYLSYPALLDIRST